MDGKLECDDELNGITDDGQTRCTMKKSKDTTKAMGRQMTHADRNDELIN